MTPAQLSWIPQTWADLAVFDTVGTVTHGCSLTRGVTEQQARPAAMTLRADDI